MEAPFFGLSLLLVFLLELCSPRGEAESIYSQRTLDESTRVVVANDWQWTTCSRLRSHDVLAHRGGLYGALGIRAGKKPSCTLLFYPLLQVTLSIHCSCVF
jgi:hypothetical protein